MEGRVSKSVQYCSNSLVRYKKITVGHSLGCTTVDKGLQVLNSKLSSRIL